MAESAKTNVWSRNTFVDLYARPFNVRHYEDVTASSDVATMVDAGKNAVQQGTSLLGDT